MGCKSGRGANSTGLYLGFEITTTQPKSLDRSGGSVVRIKPDAAKVE
jgi:hypothetical protein